MINKETFPTGIIGVPDPRGWNGEMELHAGIGTRTARDLTWGAAPPPLAGAFLTPEGATILYGRGGVGKGVIACWLVVLLVRAGHIVMIIDFEGHEREWGSRLRGLGLVDDELDRVHYRAPFGPDWTAPTGSLSAIATALREDAERLGVTYVISDSYTTGTSNGDTMGGVEAARDYFNGLTRIGRPSLTIAHVTGTADRFPDRPFGSVFVHNLARETWAVESNDGEAVDDDVTETPHVIHLELRNKKANGRPKVAPQHVSFAFHADGSIVVDAERPDGKLADRIETVLSRPMTVRAIAAALVEDLEEVVTEPTLRTTLRRYPKRFVTVDPDARPHEWRRT